MHTVCLAWSCVTALDEVERRQRNCNNPASRIEPMKELLTTGIDGSRSGALAGKSHVRAAEPAPQSPHFGACQIRRPHAGRHPQAAACGPRNNDGCAWLIAMSICTPSSKRIFSASSHWIGRRIQGIRRAVDRGMSTAEYAVGTVAAVGFAVVLYKVVRSDAVSSALSSIIRSALHAI
jgi:Protein of unknown function (DUF4244)